MTNKKQIKLHLNPETVTQLQELMHKNKIYSMSRIVRIIVEKFFKNKNISID